MDPIPQPIIDAIKADRLILWIGAGFSQRRLGLPSWRGLVDELADACLSVDKALALKNQLDAKSLTEVEALESLQPFAEKCHSVIHKRFDLHIDHSDTRLNDFHTLWQISHKIITTNYDTGLDLTLPGTVPTVIYNKKHQRKRLIDGQKFYFKLHGSASEPEDCILFEHQYQELYRDTSAADLVALSDDDTPAKYLLKHLLTNHTVLFIGFGIEDRVDFVLEYIHRLLDGIEKPKYSLIHKDNTKTWPHTDRIEVADFKEIPVFLQQLAKIKTEINPVVRGDIAISFDRPYVGRDADVEALDKFFRGTANFFFLSGAGGMGKSHLLDTVLQRLPTDQQPVYFRIERHYTMLTITQKLGIAPLSPAPKNQPNLQLLQALERVGRPLVFDDFYEISDPELFYTLLELSKWRNIKSIIISRSLPPDWARFDANVPRRELHELDRPAFDECLRGLAAQMPIFEDAPLTTGQLDACWRLCGGYPLGGQLLLSLFDEPDFDPTHIERLDLPNDPSRSHFVGRLLDVILKKGSEDERNLAREIAVFAEPVPESAFAMVPAWKPDRLAFEALWKRKGLVFRRKADNLYGMHALVRSMILQQLGDSPEARACAGCYYESLTGLPEVEQVVALQKALEHFDLSPEAERAGFRQRMQQSYMAVNVVQLRAEQSPALSIERFSFRQQLNPDDLSAANELGMAFRRQGNLQKAIEVLQKAVDAGNIQSFNELGITLRAAGQQDKAIEVLQKAVDAGHVPSMNELGITLRENGQQDKAIEVLQKAADAGHVHSMNELGITLRQAGQHNKAIEILQKAADAGNLQSITELGITLREAGQRDKAIETLQKGADAGHVHSMNELGITLREAGQRDKAIEMLQKAVDAGNIQSFTELGITLRENGQRDKAIEVLQKAVDAGNIQSFTELGITLRENGQLDKAIELFHRAAELQPNNVILLNALGITLREARQLEKAIEILQKAADSGHVHSMNELGITLREARQLEKAIEILQKAAAAGHVPSMNELGITLREAGKHEKAIEILQIALMDKPSNNTYLKHNLLQIYLFFVPNKLEATFLLDDAHTYLNALKIYSHITEHMDSLMSYEAKELKEYRMYITQIFKYKSWHFAVEYLTGLVKKHPRAEFKSKLGEALCQPVIGRSSEGIVLLREAMEEFEKLPALRHYYQQTALILLEVMSQKGNKEFSKAWERLEPILRDYPPFEEKRVEWEKRLSGSAP